MRRETLYVLLAAFLWGTTFPATRHGLTLGLTPLNFLLYRYVVAVASLFLIALWRGRVQLRLFLDWRLWMLAIGNALAYLSQYVAQSITSASKTSLLVNVNVLVTAVLAWWLLRETIGRGVWTGLALGIVGVTFLTTNGEFTVLSGEFQGDVIALTSGLIWTGMILFYKWYMSKHPEADAIAMNLVVFTVTLLIFVIASLPSGLAFTGTGESIGWILYLGIFPTTGAYLLWQEGLRGLTASVSSVLLLFETIVALSISILFLSERLSGWTAAGALLVLVAMYLASRAPAGPVVATPAPEAQV
jgi:drug/metabolite transporter (DMT)-like permease